MPSPDAPTFPGCLLRMVVNTLTDGQICQNTFDYCDQLNTAPTVSFLQLFSTNWVSSFQTLLLAVLSPKTTIQSYTVSELRYGLVPTQVNLLGSPPVGTAGATSLPLEVSVTLDRTSPLKGKHGRGRVQMPAVPNTFVTPATNASQLNAAGITAYTALASNLANTFFNSAGHSMQHCVSTRPTPPATQILNASIINNYIVQPILGTTRRRKPGRGI